MKIKMLLVFLAGIGAGAIGTYFLMRDQYETVVEEEEIEPGETSDEHVPGESNITDDMTKTDLITDSDNDEISVTKEGIEEKKVLVHRQSRYNKMVRRYDKIAHGDRNSDDPSELEHPEDDEEDYDKGERMTNEANRIYSKGSPYIISLEEFSDEAPNYDKSTIYYYADDNTLSDENEEIITDVISIVGDQALYSFGDRSEDPEIVYVRNEKLQIDYEIVCLNKSYSETVLGILPPESNRVRSRGHGESEK
jgi:hypothetical protein